MKTKEQILSGDQATASKVRNKTLVHKSKSKNFSKVLEADGMLDVLEENPIILTDDSPL